MFAVSGLWVMLSRQGGWRSLVRSLSLVILILFPGDVFAAGAPVDEAGRILSLCAVSFTVLIPVMLFAGAVLAFLAVSGRSLPRHGSTLALSVVAAVSAACFLMQWILSGHIPLSNTYETLFFAILILEILVMFVSRQGFLLRGIAMTFAGALALMAWMMGERGGETPLMPCAQHPLACHTCVACDDGLRVAWPDVRCGCRGSGLTCVGGTDAPVVSGRALSGGMAARAGDNHRSGMGQHILGTLLVVGP